MEAQHANPIKRVIQHRKTRQYFAEGGQWTAEVQRAKHFGSFSEAAEESRRYGLRDNCWLVLKFDGQGYDVHLPL